MRRVYWVMVIALAVVFGGCTGNVGLSETGETPSYDPNDAVHSGIKREVILKTGQTASYDSLGNVVSDGSIKDDGYYQKGVVRSYTRDNVNEIVTDNATGLKWRDDADAYTVKKEWIADATYVAGYYNNTSGDTAATYCENLTLGGYTFWRLPTIKELISLLDHGRNDPAFDPVFQNLYGGWSSTTTIADDRYAIGISYSSYGYTFPDHKGKSYAVPCVKGGVGVQFDFSREKVGGFFADNSAGIVTDNSSGLMWQDDTDALLTATWQEAIDRCEALIFGRYRDWRLPNINELLSIVDYSRKNPAIDKIFKNARSETYWSSTTNAAHPGSAKAMVFGHPHFNGGSFKDNSFYVRCVRGGK